MDTSPGHLHTPTEDLRQLAEELRAQLPPAAGALADAAGAALPGWRTPRLEATELGADFDAAMRRAYEVVDGDGREGVFGAALVAGLASGLPERLADRRLSPEVAELVPPALDRLSAFLRTADLSGYRWGSEPDDHLLKDVCFVAGLTVPIGAGVVDLRRRIGRRRTATLALRRRSLPAVAALLQGKGLEPLFTLHTEDRHLAEFDEPGWDRAYLRVASLLIEHPEVQGVTAAGWLYDPQISDVSPRHAYLHQRPLERGALLVPGTTRQLDIDNATATSDTRRRLYGSGRYVPRPHTMIWPRRALLSWAREARGRP